MEEISNSSVKFMTLLEKMARPVDECTINVEIGGVFVPPPEWKIADDAYPNYFSYKANFLGAEITGGKVLARELTEQEKKEIEEAQAAKKKPPPAKDKNKQPEIPQLTPEEAERQRKIEEERLEAERKAKEEWDALTDQERFYRTYEDKYKHDSFKFENNEKAVEKEGEDLVMFEESVEAGGVWLYFTKFTTLSEEEVTKAKKSKPKNLNLLDLSPCTMRVWINLTDFQTPGLSQIVYRGKVERYYNPEDKPEELPNPTLENTYMLVKISLDPAITPLITDVQPRVEDMVPKPFPIPIIPASAAVVTKFKDELVKVIESLAMEYSDMFSKEMNYAQDPRSKAMHLSNQQRQKIRDDRKTMFLYDFNTTGKYNILREKMKKCIMEIVRDKFNKTGSLTGITADSKDQFYSELYSFLTEQMRQTLNNLVQEKKDELQEDLIVSVKQANKERDAVVASITKETNSERELRLATENEMLNNLVDAEKGFKQLLNIDKKIHENAYMYCQFLLRRRQPQRAEEVLQEALRYNNQSRAYVLLLACLQARKGRKKEAVVCLNDLLEKNPSDSLSNILMSFLYSKVLNEPKLGKKYLAIAQRTYLRKIGALPSKAAPKSAVQNNSPTSKVDLTQQPQEDNTPKQVAVTDEQNDEIWVEIADYLVKNGLFDFAEQVIDEIKNKEVPQVQFFRAQIHFMKGEVNPSIEILDNLIKQYPKNSEYVLAKANYCFEKGRNQEAEDAFIQSFKIRSSIKTFSNFLRLGYALLYRKAWSDARAVLTKACEMKSKSSNGWLGLGIACLRTGEYQEGEQALTIANVYDPFNAEVWGYLSLLCLSDGARLVQAHQALREMLKCELKNRALVEELADKFASLEKLDVAEILYRKIIDVWQNNPLISSNDIGLVHSKLARIFHMQERFVDAKLFYNEAMKYIEGDTERENIGMIMHEIKSALEAGYGNNV